MKQNAQVSAKATPYYTQIPCLDRLGGASWPLQVSMQQLHDKVCYQPPAQLQILLLRNACHMASLTYYVVRTDEIQFSAIRRLRCACLCAL